MVYWLDWFSLQSYSLFRPKARHVIHVQNGPYSSPSLHQRSHRSLSRHKFTVDFLYRLNWPHYLIVCRSNLWTWAKWTPPSSTARQSQTLTKSNTRMFLPLWIGPSGKLSWQAECLMPGGGGGGGSIATWLATHPCPKKRQKGMFFTHTSFLFDTFLWREVV